jgi:hypothetical protein
MSDMAARRANLFGVPKQEAPPTDMGPVMEVLAQRINALEAECAQLRDSLAANNGALQASVATCAAETARANTLQQQLTQQQAECANLVQLLAAAAQAQPAPQQIEMPEPVDTAAIVAAVVAALPVPVAPQPPSVPKSWLLEGNDPMGNPRKVRMTPEY